MYSSRRSPIETGLHGEKARGDIRLKAEKHESHVELAGVGQPTRIIVAPAQNPVGLTPRRARVGEADVGGERRPLALRIGRVVPVGVRQGSAARLLAADDLYCSTRAVRSQRSTNIPITRMT